MVERETKIDTNVLFNRLGEIRTMPADACSITLNFKYSYTPTVFIYKSKLFL